MEEFRLDQDVEAQTKYLRWRESNPTGFVINCAPERWMIHSAQCTHLGEFKSIPANLVKHAKACSEQRGELEEWAKKKGATRLETCRSCTPA